MTKHWADAFVEELRTRAERMKAFGDDRGAKMCEETAREIELQRAAWEDEELDAVAGAAESGYTPTALRFMKRMKKWSGRRRDLPRKPSTKPQRADISGDRRREAGGQLSIAERVLSPNSGASSRRRRIGQ